VFFKKLDRLEACPTAVALLWQRSRIGFAPDHGRGQKALRRRSVAKNRSPNCPDNFTGFGDFFDLSQIIGGASVSDFRHIILD
jgi:hypothetical protein